LSESPCGRRPATRSGRPHPAAAGAPPGCPRPGRRPSPGRRTLPTSAPRSGEAGRWAARRPRRRPGRRFGRRRALDAGHGDEASQLPVHPAGAVHIPVGPGNDPGRPGGPDRAVVRVEDLMGAEWQLAANLDPAAHGQTCGGGERPPRGDPLGEVAAHGSGSPSGPAAPNSRGNGSPYRAIQHACSSPYVAYCLDGSPAFGSLQRQSHLPGVHESRTSRSEVAVRNS
jgi:hypothetical protein